MPVCGIKVLPDIFYVYLLSRPDGTPCYVGKGNGARWTKHERRGTHNPHLAHIIRNAGGSLPKQKVHDGLTEGEAFQKERELIAEIGREANGGPLVNLTDGGEGTSGFKMPPEIVERVASVNRGNKYSVGKRASPESRLKRRLAKIGRTLTEEHRAKIAASNTGRAPSPEACEKIRLSKLGKKRSAEACAAMRAANRSRDPEVRKRISIATKAAMQRLKLTEGT